MNKKGFTVIELMATFILISVVSTLLVRLAITIKEIYTTNDMKTVLLIKQSNMIDKIYQDIDKKTLYSINQCGTNCVEFDYGTDGSQKKQLRINTDNNSIRYGNYTIKLSDSNYINAVYNDTYYSADGNILKLNISIKDRIVPGEYGIDIFIPTTVSIELPSFSVNQKGNNLVRNGDLSLKNNTNLTQFGDYKNGHLEKTTSKSYTAISDEFMPVDPSKKYKIGVDIKSSNNLATYNFGIAEYDENYNLIDPFSYMYKANTLTYLTQDLNPNDTVVHLNSVANWAYSNDTNTNGIVFWNYKYNKENSYINPDYLNDSNPGKKYQFYSQNIYKNIFDSGSINTTNNTITLKNPWTGPKITASNTYSIKDSLTGNNTTKTDRTYLSQLADGTAFNYGAINNKTVSNSWKSYTSNQITGTITNGTHSDTKFRPGTKYIKIVIYGNANNTSNTTTYLRDISFKEV